MKILVGTSEICGWINLLQTELRKLGHDCDTFVKSKNPFYTAHYTYDATRYQVKDDFGNRYVNGAARRFNNLSYQTYISTFVRNAAAKYDLVIYIWDSILPDFEDVKLFKKNGAKIIFWFAGSDVRTFEHFSRAYDVSQWTFPDYWAKENVAQKQGYVKMAEEYADLIYSVPDQAGLQMRDYYHLQIPIDLSKFTCKNNNRALPNVIHMPSDPWKKGTDIIEGAIGELKNEGVAFNFLSYRNIPHSDIPNILQNADILVDELVFHGPGVLALEAMASGCAVATRYWNGSPDCFRPPVWGIEASNIKVRLRELITNTTLQQRLIEGGRKYVERNNDSSLVVRRMMENLVNPHKPDYLVAKAHS